MVFIMPGQMTSTEMHIKTSMIHHFTSTRMARIKKIITSVGEDVEK